MTIDKPDTDKKLSELYENSASELPHASVDNMIMAAAKKQAETRKKKIEKKPFFSPFPDNWMLPVSVSVFALLFLTIGIVQLMPTPQDEFDVLNIPQEESFASEKRVPLDTAKKRKDKSQQVKQSALKNPASQAIMLKKEFRENESADSDATSFADDFNASMNKPAMSMQASPEKQLRRSAATLEQTIEKYDAKLKPESPKKLFELKRNEATSMGRTRQLESSIIQGDKLDKLQTIDEQAAETWIKNIENLLRQSKDMAIDELIKFRKAYPYFIITNQALLKLEAELLNSNKN